jgi:heparosan-N-sulfate-glucuronate 5-epimerase
MNFDPWAVAFPPDDVRTDAPLGRFYQDFTAALDLVHRGVHGPMDADGRPLTAYGGAKPHYNAIIIAQYALACVPGARSGDEPSQRRLRIQADWLVDHQEQQGTARGFWVQRFDNQKYAGLRTPWVSALAQGNALSALLRAREILGDEVYLAAATIGFQTLRLPTTAGGVRWEAGDDLWLEEYPLEPAGHVLNGAIYALWGVLDFARATNDAEAWGVWKKGASTIARHVEEFDAGFWSRYELGAPELVSVHYHKNIHIPQMQAMFALTGEPVFQEMARRWTRYLHSPLSGLRRKIEGRWRWKRSRAVSRERAGPAIDPGTET